MNDDPSPVPAPVLDRLKAAVGAAGWSDDPNDLAPYLEEPRGLFHGRTPLLVRPATVEQVAEVVRICAESGTAIVPQGGNTGLCGGATPDESGREILLSLTRLKRIRAVDPINHTITVDAGCVLADVQAAAEEADRLFPLSLGAEGSCTIGGNLSTNAGGTAVLRYGNARDLVLGLEVVLPDGRLWDGLRGLRKDNTGYDLKHLFIGAEGTLGVITGAVLKLFPRPRTVATALAAPADVGAAVELMAMAREMSGDAVTAFELMSRVGLDMVLEHGTEVREPMAARHAWYALIEFSGPDRQGEIAGQLEGLLARAAAEGLIEDAVIASSQAQADALWRLRVLIAEVQRAAGGSIKNDISVPISAIPAFLAEADAAVAREIPGIRPVAFGHIGDGNVHYNLSQPVGADTAAYMAAWGPLTRIVQDIAVRHGGSISAEHGLGRLKNKDVLRYKSEVEMELMRSLKRTLDPKGIMNPGKVV